MTWQLHNWPAVALVLLAGIGASQVVSRLGDLVGWLGRKAWHRWVVPRLRRRHEAQCTPLNRAWRFRVVRHAASGRVGLCVSVSTAAGGSTLGDALRPQWEAWVTFNASIAAYLRARQGQPETLGRLVVWSHLVECFALGELALPVEGDAAEFQREMEEARSNE